ncbi:hypothetical protein TURU_028411 [Turdus rufiventris]|nr:hypothetical protein TURU_028411 [Turdus rufiventris]
MAVDITLLFKASVKTVKTRNKALGVAAAGDSARDELLKRGTARSKSDFTSRAREVELPLSLLFSKLEKFKVLSAELHSQFSTSLPPVTQRDKEWRLRSVPHMLSLLVLPPQGRTAHTVPLVQRMVPYT